MLVDSISIGLAVGGWRNVCLADTENDHIKKLTPEGNP